jgi:hypothetical protein
VSGVPRPYKAMTDLDHEISLVAAAVDALADVIRHVEKHGGALGPGLAILAAAKELLLIESGFLREPPTEEAF